MGLLAWLLLTPLRGQEPRQKQAVIPDRGRWENNMSHRLLILIGFFAFCAFPSYSEDTGFVIYKKQGFHADSQAVLTGFASYSSIPQFVTIITEKGQKIEIKAGQSPVLILHPDNSRKDKEKVMGIIDAALKRFPQHRAELLDAQTAWNSLPEQPVATQATGSDNKPVGSQRPTGRSINVNGTTYTNAVIRVVNPLTLSITYDGGVLSLPFENVPKELAVEFEMTQAKSKEYRNELARQQADKEARLQKEAVEKIKSLTKTIREVETDQRAYLGRPFILNGTLDVSSYYNYGYSNAQGRYYAFRISEGGNTASAYMLKEKAEGVREQLLKVGGVLKGSFTVVIDPNRFDENASLFLELLIVSPPLNEK